MGHCFLDSQYILYVQEVGDPFHYIVTNYIRRVTTSWTESMYIQALILYKYYSLPKKYCPTFILTKFYTITI